MSKSQYPFIYFCRQHRCYRELEQYFTNMDKSYLLRMTRLDTLGKLPLHHQFVVHARRFEFITRHLRMLFDSLNFVNGRAVCGVVSCSVCWYERG